MTQTLTGGCLCGAVRYEIDAEPIMAAFCHCLSCRKLSGGGRSPLAAFPEAAARITGQTAGYDWTADSGATVTTSFCPTCGSPLFGRNSRMEGMLGVRLGSLDHPERVAPEIELYTTRHIPWEGLDDSRPCFPEMPPMAPSS